MTAPEQSVVIGAGPNGLVAAIRLAEAGRAVTVLEAADKPGGAVRTEELTLPGFRHDTYSSVYPAAAASPVFASMPLERHGLRWIHPDVCYAHPLSNGRGLALYRDLERTAESLDAAADGDGGRWREFIGPLIDGFDAIRSTMLAPFPPLAGAVRLLADVGPIGAARFGLLVPGSAKALGTRLFRGGGPRAWLYGSAAHGDVPPTGAGSAIAATYLNLMGHVVGWPSPEGGAQRLTDALVGYLHELGGKLRTAAPVDRIEIAGGRVAGVRIVGGEHLGAHTVIADVMPHALLALVGDALPRAYTAPLRRYRYGPATVKVDWALDGPIPWQSVEARSAGTVHVSGGEEELLGTIAATRNRLAERPFLLLGQQSLADPSRAPDGKHTAWAYTHGPRSGVDWPRELERHVERMEAQVERFAPGFRELVLARHVMGPAKLERRDRNLVGGDVGGAAINSARSSSGRCRGSRRTGPRWAASTWGAPRPSPEEPCTECPGTPPRAPLLPTADAAVGSHARR